MLTGGILNPHLLSLLARVRHTNALVIADWAFPSWPEVETVDLSLVANVPTVLQVLGAILPVWKAGEAFMAEEFLPNNPAHIPAAFRQVLAPTRLNFEPHLNFKRRVPAATGLIRTADTTLYSNLILVSG
jgi:D-ribose pyranase